MDGVDAPKSSIFQLSAHVGTVLQDPDGQFIGLTVGEDIAFALENSCMPQDEMHEITRHAAELVGIQDHLDYAPHELSGGQKAARQPGGGNGGSGENPVVRRAIGQSGSGYR